MRRLETSLFVISTSFLFILSLASSQNDGLVSLPYQLGPHPVSASNHELLTDRPETLAPDADAGFRRLMVTIYQPLTGLSTCPHPASQPYMPQRSAQIFTDLLDLYGIPSPNNDLLSQVSMSFCPASSQFLHDSDISAPVVPQPDNDADRALPPLIVFSHGRTSSRLLSQTLSGALASAGFAVLAVDHPYDAAAVEFPDGTLIRSNYLPDLDANMSEAEVGAYTARVVDVRAADVRSVLDAVERGAWAQELAGYAANATVDAGRREKIRAGVLGHSLGGATAAMAVLDGDERVLAGANMDGTVWGRATNTSSEKPFVMVACDWGQPEIEIIQPTWDEQYPLLAGFKRWLAVKGSKHLSFFDGLIIADLLGLREGASMEVLGTIEGARMLEIMYRYFVDFFGMVLKGEGQGLLAGESSEFEEVEFVRADDRSKME